MGILLSDTGIIICELLIISVMIIFIIRLLREKRKNSKNAITEKEQQQRDALDRKLINSKGKHR